MSLALPPERDDRRPVCDGQDRNEKTGPSFDRPVFRYLE
jgi:hypothetical protein